MSGKHADPNLPAEGDYPTDEIDVWPLLAEGYVVDDNGAHHDKRNGRFAKKEKAPIVRNWVSRTFGHGDDARQVDIRLFSRAEIADLPLGPEPEAIAAWDKRFPDGAPTFWEWPTDADEEVTVSGAVITAKPKDAVAEKVEPRKRERPPIPPDTSVIRSWAHAQGYPVGTKGKLPKAVVDAYMKARAQ